MVDIPWRLIMAFELVGESPKSSLGTCIRVNIWKWYEFVSMLLYFNIIDKKTSKNLMTNDNFFVTKEESNLLYKKIIEKLGKNLENIIKFEDHLRSVEGQKKYSRHKGYSDLCCQMLNGTDVKYILYFLDNCGGFKVV